MRPGPSAYQSCHTYVRFKCLTDAHTCSRPRDPPVPFPYSRLLTTDAQRHADRAPHAFRLGLCTRLKRAVAGHAGPDKAITSKLASTGERWPNPRQARPASGVRPAKGEIILDRPGSPAATHLPSTTTAAFSPISTAGAFLRRTKDRRPCASTTTQTRR